MATFHTLLRRFLLALLLLTAANAGVAGALFMIAPDGSLMGMDTAYLGASPFADYFVPGLVLFLVNGVLNLLAAFWVWRKHRLAWPGTLVQGILLCGWILVQVYFVRDLNFLHISMLAIGLVLVGGALLMQRAVRTGTTNL